MLKGYKNKKLVSRGFTIIELIVVLAIFFFIIGAAISSFITIVQSQKRVLAEQQLINQISYLEEYMSKAIRMAALDRSVGEDCVPSGYIYLFTHSHTVGSAVIPDGIRFLNQSSGDCQEFFLDNSVHEDTTTPLVLKELKGANGVADSNLENAIPLTSLNLQIEDVSFSINGNDNSGITTECTVDPTTCGGARNNDGVQPKVTILFKIKVPDDTQSERVIQTTVSQRNLNAKVDLNETP